MAKILWIGGIAWEKTEKPLLSKNGPGAEAATLVQENIIYSIISKFKYKVSVLNDYPCPYYPKAKLIYIPKRIWGFLEDGNCKDIFQINILIIRHLSKVFNLYKELKKYLKNNTDVDYMINYTVHTPYLLALALVKKVNPNIKLCLICPDLPEFTDLELNNKPVKRFVKQFDISILNWCFKKVDCFVLFTEHMKDKLPINDKPYVVMEGIIDPEKYPLVVDKRALDNNEKIIMYSGMTHKKYGIIELVEAFKLIGDENYRLWITGDGDAKEYIINEAIKDKRIIYYGFLAKRDDLLRLQQEATVLISTRKPSETASAYCFPSKIMEYMASSTPVLTFRILGIPDEYYDYLIEIPDEKIESIKDKIVEICEKPRQYLIDIGAKSREFVLKNKNNDVQTEKIIRMLEERGQL